MMMLTTTPQTDTTADVANKERLSILLLQEPAYLCPTDYMKDERENQSSSCPLNKVLSDASIGDVTKPMEASQRRSPHQSMQFWREQMFDWACTVVDSFGADREVIAVSFNLLDRYLVHELQRPTALSITRDDYQLFSMTCLYLAIKVLEPYPRKLSIQTLVDMSKQYYSRHVIEQTERDILCALQWRLHAPTALAFARVYAQITTVPSHHQAIFQATMRTLTELTIATGQFLTDSPSQVGLAAVVMAAQQMGLEDRISCLEKECSADFQSIFIRLHRVYWD